MASKTTKSGKANNNTPVSYTALVKRIGGTAELTGKVLKSITDSQSIHFLKAEIGLQQEFSHIADIMREQAKDRDKVGSQKESLNRQAAFLSGKSGESMSYISQIRSNIKENYQQYTSLDLSKDYHTGHLVGSATQVLEIWLIDTRKQINLTSGSRKKKLLERESEIKKGLVALKFVDGLGEYAVAEYRERLGGTPTRDTIKQLTQDINTTIPNMLFTVKKVSDIKGILGGRIEVDFELGMDNKWKGELANKIISEVRKAMKNESFSDPSHFLFNIKAQDVEMSPTTTDDLEYYLDGVLSNPKGEFAGRKSDREKSQKIPIKRTLAAAAKKLEVALKKERKSAERKRAMAKSAARNSFSNKIQEDLGSLFGVLALINAGLQLKVKEMMGKSSDPAVKLRYQTGTFSESAKLLSLTRSESGVLAASYTYQHYPYDVFLPGGRLGTRERDPRLYVEGAIRSLAMSILKRKFPGITLDMQ